MHAPLPTACVLCFPPELRAQRGERLRVEHEHRVAENPTSLPAQSAASGPRAHQVPLALLLQGQAAPVRRRLRKTEKWNWEKSAVNCRVHGLVVARQGGNNPDVWGCRWCDVQQWLTMITAADRLKKHWPSASFSDLISFDSLNLQIVALSTTNIRWCDSQLFPSTFNCNKHYIITCEIADLTYQRHTATS